jgi:ABC-type transporter Mla subunit MlaD
VRRTYRDLSLVLAGGLVVLGALIALRTWQLGTGGGFGYVLAALFAAAGLGRIYLLRR